MVNYDDHASGFGNDDLKLTTLPYAAIDGDFAGVRVGDSQYGMSIGERYENTILVDGALYQRKDDPSKIKLYSWQTLGFDPEDETFTPAEFKRKSENYGGDTYNYSLVAARVDETGETWTDDSDEFGMNDDGFPEVGNVIIWNGGSSDNGPNSTAKTAARTLTRQGREAVLDADDVYNWLDSNIEARPELEGKRIRRFKVEREGRKYSFYTPVFLDVEFDQRIGIPNGDNETAPSGKSEETSEANATAADGGSAVAQAAAQAQTTYPSPEDSFPDPIADCIDYCAEQGITDGEDVLGTLNVMAQNPDSSVTIEMIEEAGQESIVESVQEKAE